MLKIARRSGTASLTTDSPRENSRVFGGGETRELRAKVPLMRCLLDIVAEDSV